ncbi:MAG: ATP-binding protein [Chitinophagaceae bacterium]|nr:ATP-binding protein [Rubrivivax sp.]
MPNELGAFEDTRSRVLAFVAGHRLSPRVLYHLELVLEETLMNRLMHAFPQGSRSTDLSVQVSPADAPSDIVLCFEDDGVPFDPRQAPEPTWPISIESATPGGLGLHLTRKVASSSDYARVDGRNRYTVRVARG